VQYWVHRLVHRIPALWRFHAVHHSAQNMDWMAGARMHFLEILVLRGTTVFPMILLGFTQGAVNAYVLVVYLFATFAHSNLGWKLGFFEKFFVTPRFHHWHHGIEKEAIDVNFSIHFPLFDKLFGTHHLPENSRWPEGYGIGGRSNHSYFNWTVAMQSASEVTRIHRACTTGSNVRLVASPGETSRV